MKSFLTCLLLISSSAYGSVALAQTSAPTACEQMDVSPAMTEVNESTLTLLGRGIVNRKNRDLISMACVGSAEAPCNCLRHVYFNQESRQAYFFGSPIHVELTDDPAESPKALKKAVHHLAKSFRRYQKDHRTEGQKALRASAWFLLSGVGAIGSVLLFPVGSAACLYALGTYSSFGGLAWLLIVDRNGIVGSDLSTVNAMKDQNGWNWSSHPKSLSEKKFELYKSGVLNQEI